MYLYIYMYGCIKKIILWRWSQTMAISTPHLRHGGLFSHLWSPRPALPVERRPRSLAAGGPESWGNLMATWKFLGGYWMKMMKIWLDDVRWLDWTEERIQVFKCIKHLHPPLSGEVSPTFPQFRHHASKSVTANLVGDTHTWSRSAF